MKGSERRLGPGGPWVFDDGHSDHYSRSGSWVFLRSKSRVFDVASRDRRNIPDNYSSVASMLLVGGIRNIARTKGPTHQSTQR